MIAARVRGMVASSQTLASEIGAAVLADGGTAADACVAMDAALHVTEPTSTGLGGDTFALYYEAATSRVTALNGSGRAPAALTLDAVRGDGVNVPGPSSGLWVTVPGCCAGWAELASRHGSMLLQRLLAPAIALAEEGFPVGAVTAAVWERGLVQLHSRELTIDGRAPRAGELFRNPALARTLRSIAAEGVDAFYKGEIARTIADGVRHAGGVMTESDLFSHFSTWDEAVSTTYRGVRVWESPPNSQGIAALLALNVLEGFEPGEPGDPQRWHLLIEALRIAFADARWWTSDPRLSDVPVEALLAPAYSVARRRLLDPGRATIDVRRGAPRDRGGTVYHCAVDARGNACSMASSHFMGFGTGVIPPGLGFVLHNRALGFSLDPAHPNVIAPGKRPYHTVMPGLLTRAGGALWGPFGIMGGFMQPQGHVQLVTALVDDVSDPQAALDRPRFCIDSGDAGGVVQLEEGVPAQVVELLRSRGHPLEAGIPSFGRALFGRGQVILQGADGLLAGGSDRRGDGGVSTVSLPSKHSEADLPV
ncbi:MAG TPA: gamma-glutamyltransferase family protein [Gemmatimonadaceae bacterium]|nr:gamma-glutamyltransferase family protein [Gemmatimonadaceae bacterium]